jgi:hypothetical protein
MARLDHKATAISLLVVLGVRGWSEGLHAVKATGGESIRPYRCTINMYLICMCWLRRSAPPKRAVTGRIEDRGAEKTATIDPKFGFIRGIPGFPGPPLPLGVIQ